MSNILDTLNQLLFRGWASFPALDFSGSKREFYSENESKMTENQPDDSVLSAVLPSRLHCFRLSFYFLK